jgi:hypothetical protein
MAPAQFPISHHDVIRTVSDLLDEWGKAREVVAVVGVAQNGEPSLLYAAKQGRTVATVSDLDDPSTETRGDLR